MSANHWMTLISSLLLLGLAFWLIRRGWTRRVRRDADVPSLPPVPAEHDGAPSLFAAEVKYVSTTTAGDWLDRIASQGLGFASRGTALVFPDGVIITRQGAEDLWIPGESIQALRREAGMAGKFVERKGLVVITWRLGERLLDSGLRVRQAQRTQPLLEQLHRIAPQAAESLTDFGGADSGGWEQSPSPSQSQSAEQHRRTAKNQHEHTAEGSAVPRGSEHS